MMNWSRLNNKSPINSATIYELPSSIKEHFYTLRDRIVFSSVNNPEPPRIIGITSCYRGEGVSTIASNLALTFSSQNNILLIDTNLIEPSVHRIFNHNISPGLIDILESDNLLTSKVSNNINIIPSGKLNGVIPRKYDSAHSMSNLFSQLKLKFDYVLLDMPSIFDNSAALRFASIVDGLILVVEANRTRKHSIIRANNELNQINANVIGLVLNKREFPIPNIFYKK